MVPSRWTCLSAIGIAVFACREVRAQSCCAGSVATTPGRLAMHEDALVGVQLKASRSYGAHDVETHYAKDPPGSAEVDLEQDLLATVRVGERLEVGTIVPFVETWRKIAGTTGFGQGLGDVAVVGRYDLLRTREREPWPGIALVAGITAPTGRPPEKAQKTFAADATGIGAFQLTGGLLVEQVFDPFFVVGALYLSARTPRTSEGVKTQLGPQGTLLLAFGRSFPDDSAIALVATRSMTGNASVDGVKQDGSGSASTTIGVNVLHPFTDRWRMQASLYANPPFSGLGKNQIASGTFTLMFARGWS